MAEADRDTHPVMLVSLHDVCPASWPLYKPFLDELEARCPAIRSTLLVVPDFHRQGRIDNDPAFCKAMEYRLAEGDELVLHGYHHHDERPLPLHPREFLMRRLLTHEGEFYGLDAPEAEERLEAGMRVFQRLGWPLKGFVAPGWLLSDGGRQILGRKGFRYTTDHRHAWSIPEWRSQRLPTLVWSARSPARRALSHRWNRLQRRRYQEAPALRLAIHPVDLRHAISHRFWIETICDLAQQRRSLTKGEWMEDLF
ncbi:DUF2334 domain-containing protein [Mangrovitalea sediminis]|uniref:DUF2334 domain-containing protein n=1 Tax=Mangrovitalea sediminis TaxID=1982043 RepID=UPI000BE5F3F7|nr:polysaccharide deacetylase family protein [Mangrovitalea sediminis]